MGEEVKENANNDIGNSSFKEDYIGILELSPIERMREYMYQYFAKIQTDTYPKFVFSVVTGIFLCIQAIFPALMQQAELQRETSTIGRGMRIISVVWCGGGAFEGDAPFITSIIASIISLAIISAIAVRSYIYSRVKSMRPTEINVMFTISTYILPILTSFTTCCIGDGIYLIVNNSITAFEIISLLLAIFAFVIQAKMQYDIISPRVMFIRDITLMWTPFSSVLITIASGVNAAIFSATVHGSKYAKTVELIVMFIFSYVIGIYLFLDSVFINKLFGIFYCALLLTNGSTCILNIVAGFIKFQYNILFFIVILFVVLSVLILYFMHMKFSQLSMATLDAAAEESFFYGRSDNLARDVRRSLDYCSPGVFFFNLYDNFIEDGIEQCKDMLFVYARIVSAFPSYKYKLELISDTLKQSSLDCRRLLNFQIQYLIMHRNTAVNSKIVKAFDQIANQSKVLKINMRRFWENVLQANNDAFWTNIDIVNKLQSELARQVNEVVNDYENCPEVVSEAVNIHSTLTFQFDEAKELKKDLDMLEKGLPAHKDRALINMISLFPNVMNSISDLTKEIDIVGNALRNKEVDREEVRKREITNELINNSKVGKYFSSGLFFTLMAIISIAFFVLYILMFEFKILDNVSRTYSFIATSNRLMHAFARFLFTKIVNYGLYTSQSGVFSDSDDMMKNISPFWFEEGHLSKINVSYDRILDTSQIIRSAMENMSLSISKLDTSISKIYDFVTFYNNYVFEGTNQTVSESISSIMMINDNFNEDFVNTSTKVYRQLKRSLESMINNLSFQSKIKENSNYMILSLLVSLILYSFPSVLHFFKLITTMHNIAICFSSLPAPVLRKAIGENSTTSATEEKKEEDDISSISAMSMLTMNFQFYFGLFLSAFPCVILCYGFYFCSMSHIRECDTIVQSAGMLRTALSDVRMSFLATAVAFLNGYPIADKYETNKAMIDRLLSLRNQLLEDAIHSNANQLVLSKHELGEWMAIQDKYRKLWDPLGDYYDKIPIMKSNFERLATYRYLMQIDCFIFLSKLTVLNQPPSLTNINYNAYYLWWVYDEVEKEFYEAIIAGSNKSINSGEIFVTVFLTLFIIFQFLSLFYTIYSIYKFSRSIKIAMKLLILVDLEVIMNDEQLLEMIHLGSVNNITRQKDHFTYGGGFYLKFTETSIAMVDRELNIVEYNETFNQMLPGIKTVKELNSDDLSITIYNIFERKCDYTYQTTINTTNSLGSPVHARATVIAMNDTRALMQHDETKITGCALILQDISKFAVTEMKIQKKKEQILEMLKVVIPESAVNELQNGSESISSTVHSISIGRIEVIVKSDLETIQNMQFLSMMYKNFDHLLTEYSTLTKIRTFANEYTFAGGIFMSVNKPEKHAEETVRFCLDILKGINHLKEEVKVDFDIKIGIHTGGPVIAGVISTDYPSYQILGNVEQYTEKLMRICDPNKLRVSRSVYELVFSAGFKVAEAEPIKIGNETVQTYSIDVR